jgi:integrase
MAMTDTFIKNIKPTAAVAGVKYADGQGLYLLVKPAGKYWRINFRHLGKQKTLALGTYPEISLAQARQRREQARRLMATGIDPSAAKKAEKVAQLLASTNDFESVANDWLSKTSAERVPRTQLKIRTWLERDVFPHLGTATISNIGARDVLMVVRRIESRGAVDTAHRIKQVCGQVFRYAVATGLAERDVTADLRGALTVAKTEHRPALTTVVDVTKLMKAIVGYSGYAVTRSALLLSPHVFLRPGELRFAEWVEIDLEAGEWRIPGTKMKMKVDHIIPLSRQAVEILTAAYQLTGHGKYVFPGIRSAERPISDNTVNAALRGLGITQDQHTAHGFRAMARTLLDEVLGERVDLIEHQLAHAVRDPNGRAYNRTSHLPARKKMMQRWSDYLDDLIASQASASAS